MPSNNSAHDRRDRSPVRSWHGLDEDAGTSLGTWVRHNSRPLTRFLSNLGFFLPYLYSYHLVANVSTQEINAVPLTISNECGLAILVGVDRSHMLLQMFAVSEALVVSVDS